MRTDFGIGHTETRAESTPSTSRSWPTSSEACQDERRRVGSDTPKLDIVAFDACDLATVEMTVQLQQYAKYLLASQIGIPLPGWPYRSRPRSAQEPFGEVMGPAEFGTYVVRRFCEHYHAEERKVSLTLLDLSRAAEVAAHAEVLALRLAMTLADSRRNSIWWMNYFASPTRTTTSPSSTSPISASISAGTARTSSCVKPPARWEMYSSAHLPAPRLTTVAPGHGVRSSSSTVGTRRRRQS